MGFWVSVGESWDGVGGVGESWGGRVGGGGEVWDEAELWALMCVTPSVKLTRRLIRLISALTSQKLLLMLMRVVITPLITFTR